MQTHARENKVFYTIGDLARRYKASRDSIRRWVRAGKFPRPKRLGVGVHRWDELGLLKYEADPEKWVVNNRRVA